MLRISFLLPLALGLSACIYVPAYLEKPADPSARVPRAGYQPVASETKTYRPVGPKGWEELNRRVAPKS
jgi:starvation-inducible outer membrane lipoprotein